MSNFNLENKKKTTYNGKEDKFYVTLYFLNIYFPNNFYSI